jgi:hypothetical protein
VSYGTIKRGRMAADQIGSHFTQIHNQFFRDPRVTGTAKGVFGLISTHRDGYGISVETLCEDMKEGPSAVKAALRNLEEHGYLVRTRVREPDGTLGASQYEITDMPDGLRLTADPPYPPADTPPPPPDEHADSETETSRSEPRVDFPPVDDPPVAQPPVDDRARKNNNNKNNNSQPPTGVGSRAGAPARAHAPAPAREGGVQDTLDLADTKIDSKSQTGRRTRKRPWPGEFVPQAKDLAWAAKHYPRTDVAALTEEFNAYWDAVDTSAETERERPVRDWAATWRKRFEMMAKNGWAPRRAEPPAKLTEQAAPTVEAWVRWWGQRGPVTHRARVELMRLVVQALEAGATIEQVQAALRECRELCPAPFRFQNALLGAPGGRTATPSTTDARVDAVDAAVEEAKADLARLRELGGRP